MPWILALESKTRLLYCFSNLFWKPHPNFRPPQRKAAPTEGQRVQQHRALRSLSPLGAAAELIRPPDVCFLAASRAAGVHLHPVG